MRKGIAVIVIIVIVMMIGIGYFVLNQKNSNDTNEIENTMVNENREEENNGSLEEEVVETMRIRVSDGSHEITFELNDSEASTDLYGQLPLTLEVENFGSNEKIFYPTNELDVGNTPRANSNEAGILAYYEPWGDVVMFYDSFSSASGLYELGTALEGTDQIENLSGEISIERLEN